MNTLKLNRQPKLAQRPALEEALGFALQRQLNLERYWCERGQKRGGSQFDRPHALVFSAKEKEL